MKVLPKNLSCLYLYSTRIIFLHNIIISHHSSNTKILSTTTAMSTTKASTTTNKIKIIDSHLHIWANTQESKQNYPYASKDQTPPETLQDRASSSYLLQTMKDSNVDGALIVQPINHKYDHSYVSSAMKTHPSKFKGMLLHDPLLSSNDAVERLEELVLQGFVGVRFNPYLWPSTNTDKPFDNVMSRDGGSGLAVYKRCGELKIPVGIMCFKGLDLHYNDIIQLIEKSPDTILILDHFGFTKLGSSSSDDNNKKKADECFKLLLSLSKYPSVNVKVSALFRQHDSSSSDVENYPYERLRKERFIPLLNAFGSNRLMFGSDFPFVLEQEEGYHRTVDLVQSWCNDFEDKQALMSGTAELLFGIWG